MSAPGKVEGTLYKGPRSARAGRFRRMLRGGARVAYVAVVAILLLEVALRILSQVPGSSATFVSDPDVGFRLRPGLVVGANATNSLGFNDAGPGGLRRSRAARVAVIGDSFVFGAVARGQNFVQLVGELAGRRGAPIETFNLGIPAAGPEQYLGLLRHDAAALELDLAVVVFFVGNDVSQSHPDFKTRVWLGAPRSLLSSPFLIKPSLDYVYAYKLLRGGWRSLRHRFHRLRDRGAGGTFPESVFLEIEHRRLQICRREQPPPVAAAYAGAADLLRRIRDEGARQGLPLLVVLAPDQFQVDDDLWQRLAARYELQPELYDRAQPQRILGASLRSLAVPALDLLPAFRERASRERLYLARDTHWNEAGNLLAAKLIAAALAPPAEATAPGG